MTRDPRHQKPVTHRITYIALGCIWLALHGNVFGQVKGSALLLPASAPANVQTNKQLFLRWDSSEPKFNIYTGTNRASLAKRATISTNAYPLTKGLVYGVTSLNFAGIESTMAYWPSNRVGELVWQYSTNMTTWTDGQIAETFTNVPKTPQMYLRWIDRTKEWRPPN